MAKSASVHVTLQERECKPAAIRTERTVTGRSSPIYVTLTNQRSLKSTKMLIFFGCTTKSNKLFMWIPRKPHAQNSLQDILACRRQDQSIQHHKHKIHWLHNILCSCNLDRNKFVTVTQAFVLDCANIKSCTKPRKPMHASCKTLLRNGGCHLRKTRFPDKYIV